MVKILLKHGAKTTDYNNERDGEMLDIINLINIIFHISLQNDKCV